MFLARFFRYSFQYSKIMTRVNEKFWKYLIYFVIICMVNIFPLNYLIVKEQGWRLDFIEESFVTQTPSWNLPDTCSITASRLVCSTDDQYTFEHLGITYIFNYQSSEYDMTKKQVIFKENEIVYVNGDNAIMTGKNYSGFEHPVSFLELNLAQGDDRSMMYFEFGQFIESSFSPYIVLYTLLVNSITSIALNMLFIILLSLVLQLFKFGYSKFFTYIDSLKFLMLMTTIPALLSFVIGLFEPAFSPVFYQLGMGISTMLVMLIHGKKIFI
ncbi:MAG: DUF1189 family protein [Acholeplasmataceae bacterium]|nr:DUF1189 family protein [Acholeplasmataceae bacterium]